MGTGWRGPGCISPPKGTLGARCISILVVMVYYIRIVTPAEAAKHLVFTLASQRRMTAATTRETGTTAAEKEKRKTQTTDNSTTPQPPYSFLIPELLSAG
jgi:hypothetical protein